MPGAPGVAQQQTETKPAQTEDLADIVVVARKGAPIERPDAVGYYRRYCYDPVRLTGRFAPPDDDGDWQKLSEAMRAKFAITDPAVPAFGSADPARGMTLVVKFERLPRDGKVTELRCTLAVLGGDHRGFGASLSALFRGPPTQRHVGREDGYPKIAGWQQWLWSGYPTRGSKNWRSINEGRKAANPTWLIVTDLNFYNEYDYIIGDLKTREQGQALSTLTFAYVTKRPLP